jgi:hypothetical protein
LFFRDFSTYNSEQKAYLSKCLNRGYNVQPSNNNLESGNLFDLMRKERRFEIIKILKDFVV